MTGHTNCSAKNSTLLWPRGRLGNNLKIKILAIISRPDLKKVISAAFSGDDVCFLAEGSGWPGRELFDAVLLDADNSAALAERTWRLQVPVLVFDRSFTDRQIESAIRMGAASIIFWPVSPADLRKRVLDCIDNASRYIDAQFDYLVKRCRQIESPDGTDARHIDRVGNLSCEIAVAMGLQWKWASYLRLAAKIHDIGKTVIRPDILHKPGPLTPEEFNTVKKHTVFGEAIISAFNKDSLFGMAREIALSHHERWDGSGYPKCLKGKDIPLSSRIVAVADVIDALTYERAYKPVWTIGDAVTYVRKESGRLFDPEIVQAIPAQPASSRIQAKQGEF